MLVSSGSPVTVLKKLETCWAEYSGFAGSVGFGATGSPLPQAAKLSATSPVVMR